VGDLLICEFLRNIRIWQNWQKPKKGKPATLAIVQQMKEECKKMLQISFCYVIILFAFDAIAYAKEVKQQ
jgi:hypothetical protein